MTYLDRAEELGVELIGPEQTPEERALKWLQTEADDNILICRGRGPRHGFDPLIRGRVLRNTWSLPIGRQGLLEGYRLMQLCPDCRLVWRELVAGPDQVIPEPAKWRYWWDPKYKPPKGCGRIRSGAARSESSRRMAEAGTIEQLAAKPLPRHVQRYVEAADLRAEMAAARSRR